MQYMQYVSYTVVSNTAIELQRDDNKSIRGDLEDL